MRNKIRDFLKINLYNAPVAYQTIEEVDCGKYRRLLISYLGSEGDTIPAYLLIPVNLKMCGAVLIHHQHNSERHYGKSEVAGIVGNPLQAFAPTLASLGFVVLAPDSICFEDRRKNKTGTNPDSGDQDFLQHFNQMTFRIAQGDTLMRKVLDDACIGLSLLSHLQCVDQNRMGVLGHSYGGNTTLFQAALDERITFACSSGAACSYKHKMESDIPFEFALAIPGISKQFDVDDLVKAIAPREILIVSATADKYSQDADSIYHSAKAVFSDLNVPNRITHKRFEGNHALTADRFNFILNWVAKH
jgi:dienelactone hydrolase